MIILQLLIYCLLFTAMVKIAVIGGAVNGLYFYPKTVQDQAIELGLIDRNTMNRKRKCFMIPFFVVMLAALVLIIGLWNGASSFGEAYWQALLFLEVMNVYDGHNTKQLLIICSGPASPGSSPRISRAAHCRYPPGTCPASHRF